MRGHDSVTLFSLCELMCNAGRRESNQPPRHRRSCRTRKKKTSDSQWLFGVFFFSFVGALTRYGCNRVLYSEHVCVPRRKKTTEISTSVVNVAMHARAIQARVRLFFFFFFLLCIPKIQPEPCVRVILRLSIK
jgi:hypothetical protein